MSKKTEKAREKAAAAIREILAASRNLMAAEQVLLESDKRTKPQGKLRDTIVQGTIHD